MLVKTGLSTVPILHVEHVKLLEHPKKVIRISSTRSAG